MSAKTASPEEVQSLVAEGYAYVDVRTEAEFDSGHPPGAFNVPVTLAGAPNPEFVAVLERAFGKDAKLVLGCKAGPRSHRAAELLAAAGFTDLVEMPAGMAGGRDAFGRALPGWAQSGLPVEMGAPAGQRYSDVKARER